jgi:hypothetical protein
MYYGIAGGAKVFIDCKVNYQEIDAWNLISSYKMAMEQEWTLTSRYEETSAKVTVRAVNNSDRRVVISMLLAGLKTIDDSELYAASVASIETNMGFQVDRLIPAGVGEITDTVMMYPDNAGFEISISETVGSQTLGMPHVEAFNMIDEGKIRIQMKVGLGHSNSLKSYMEFDAELWHEQNSMCLQYAQEEMIHSLYAEIPHAVSAVSQLRYKLFENDMKGVSAQSMYKVVSETPKWIPSGNFTTNPAAEMYPAKSAPDRRVKQLPALDEIVKNPVTRNTGTLRSVIISLNDGSKWTREAIADWLETLDIDISFKTKENDEQD